MIAIHFMWYLHSWELCTHTFHKNNMPLLLTWIFFNIWEFSDKTILSLSCFVMFLLLECLGVNWRHNVICFCVVQLVNREIFVQYEPFCVTFTNRSFIVSCLDLVRYCSVSSKLTMILVIGSKLWTSARKNLCTWLSFSPISVWSVVWHGRPSQREGLV